MRKLYTSSAILLGAGLTMMMACSSDPGPLPQECPVYDADPTTGSGDTSGSGDTTDTSGSGDTTTSGSGGSGTTSTGSGASSQGAGAPAFNELEVQAKLHGCRKLRYETLGSVLRDRGANVDAVHNSLSLNQVIGECLSVSNQPAQCTTPDMLVRCQNDDSNGTNTFPSNLRQDMCAADEFCFCPVTPCTNSPSAPQVAQGNAGFCVKETEVINNDVIEELHPSAAFLYQTAKDSMSVPKVDDRTLEKDGHTTASAMKVFDIFVQAAPTIIANISNPTMAPACTINGDNPEMFDPGDGSCVEEAVSCLIGYPATDDHLLLCNLILDKADPTDPIDVQKKQFIAVATLLSAANTCE